MARLTVNETGTQPLVLISTTVANAALLANGNITGANVLSVTCLQDITITSSTGVYSYVDFCAKDINKLPTPADNEITMNVVIDDEAYFGNSSASANSAAERGIANISQNKVPVQFLVVWNYNANVAQVTNGNISNGTALSNVAWSSGKGYVTNLAPTAAPDAPVWVTPLTIAVDGTMYTDLTV
jgi:hypothetical protein